MKAGIKLKYLGHGGFYIEFGGKKLVFDPFFTKIEDSNIRIEDVEADYILLTHGHFDHVADVEALANRTGAEIIASFEVATAFEKLGFTVHPMNLGGKVVFDFGIVKYVNAVHSSEMPDGSYGGPSGGFVIWNQENSFYIAGDTALTWDMKLIPMTCPKLDFAILPIGDRFTMGYEDAVIAAEFIDCNKIIACHHNTFEIIKVEKITAINAFEQKAKTLVWMEVGESKII